jgi:LacI family transcriptional regulator
LHTTGLVVECQETKAAGAEAVRLWFEKTPPSAIFASIDMQAYGALEAQASKSIRVSEDIALVGFDDLPASAHVQPPLTTVKEPVYLMGQTAVRMLLELFETGVQSQKHIELDRINCTRVMRRTTKP